MSQADVQRLKFLHLLPSTILFLFFCLFSCLLFFSELTLGMERKTEDGWKQRGGQTMERANAVIIWSFKRA